MARAEHPSIGGIVRRSFLGAVAAAGWAPRAGAATPLAVAVFGQALIQYDLRQHPWPDFGRLAAMFGNADIAFTDLETAITGPLGGPPTRDGMFAHTAGPAVLDCLKDLRVNMLAHSNNHAFDLNSGGIVDALHEMRSRGFTHAGTGTTLADAAAPAIRQTPNGSVALVAMASGQIREGGAATNTRPGVNEARRDPGRGLNEDDVQRVLDAIRAAATQADLVVMYHHNHYLEKDLSATPPWQQALARRCVDAGASMFVSHGVPLLHGIELYRGKPVFYGLGSLVFQSATEEGHYDGTVWQSVVAECRFAGGAFLGATLTPVQLNETGIGGPGDLETRGRPSIATGDNAGQILARLAALSRPFGAVITPDAGGTASLAA